MVLASQAIKECANRGLAGAVRRHMHGRHEAQVRSRHDKSRLVVLFEEVRQELDAEVDDRREVCVDFAVEGIQVDLFRLVELDDALDARVDKDAV